MYKFKAEKMVNGDRIEGHYSFSKIFGHTIRDKAGDWSIDPKTLVMIEGPELDKIKELEEENRRLIKPGTVGSKLSSNQPGGESVSIIGRNKKNEGK